MDLMCEIKDFVWPRISENTFHPSRQLWQNRKEAHNVAQWIQNFAGKEYSNFTFYSGRAQRVRHDSGFFRCGWNRHLNSRPAHTFQNAFPSWKWINKFRELSLCLFRFSFGDSSRPFKKNSCWTFGIYCYKFFWTYKFVAAGKATSSHKTFPK